MSRWPQVPFDEIVSARGSGALGLPQSEWLAAGKYPVIGQGAEFIEGWTDRADLLLTPEPAVVLYGGHTRRAKYVDTPFVPGPNVKILEPAGRLDAKFLYRFLEQLHIESRGYADHFPEVRRCSIPIPPLSDQRRIAAILDQANALRVKRREALAQLDGLMQSIFMEMFGGLDIPKETIGSLLQLGVLLLHKDGNHGSQYPRSEDFGDVGIPFLSARCISDDGIIQYDVIDRLREAKAAQLRIGWIEAGDVLLAHNASVGKVALYDGRFPKALIGTSLTAFRANRERLTPHFLAAALRSQRFQAQLAMNMGQTTRNQVPITAQRELFVPLPSLALQKVFTTRIEAVETLKASHRTSLAEMDALFASLQQRAFADQLS